MLAKTISAILALATIMLIQPRSTEAAPYWPWCSRYFSRDAPSQSCAFSSWEQCMDTVRGIGGYCYTNPYGPPPPPPYARAAKSSRHAGRY